MFFYPPRNLRPELLDLDEAPFAEVQDSLGDVRRVNKYLSGYKVLLFHVRKLLKQIDWWKDYTSINNTSLDSNPTPGNKKGGLTTILEKSLGAVAKSGTSTMMDVLDYSEQISSKGFNFMDTPGFDPVSVTGQVASGANVICFTTGRGSCFGFKPSPSIKIATNTNMFNKLEEDMDINAGKIMDGESNIEEVGNQIFHKIIAVASGEQTKSELNGYGDDEFNPWVIGATM